MKLLHCEQCGDIFKLRPYERRCECGATRGHYNDSINATHNGGVPIGILNQSFYQALTNRPDKGWGEGFTAFIIARDSDSVQEE